MDRKLYNINEVSDLINRGNKMVLSADEETLKQLPKGNWIAGSTPYFMDKEEGVFSKKLVFVDDFTDLGTDFQISTYTSSTIKNICKESFDNGFTVLVLPFEKEVYYEFSLNSLSYANVFNNPLVGFVAGCDFDLLDTDESKVVNGITNEIFSDVAIALHVKLPSNKLARTEILNLDTPQTNSDKIIFPTTSFTQSECTVNGEKMNIAEYLTAISYKEKAPRPLIANTNGALINRDIKDINLKTKEVTFFSPVFADDEYYLTTIIEDYQSLFNERLKSINDAPAYTSICVSYYLLGDLEHKKVNITGAFAFGEIAFQLLNKTLVLLEIDQI